MEPYLSLDSLRAALVLLLAFGQAVMGQWPDVRGWPATVASRSAAKQLPITPFPKAFAIWAVIFSASFAFAVHHALPANLEDPLLRTLGWLSAAAFLLNLVWEWHVPTHDIDWTSVALIALELMALLAAMGVLRQAGPIGGTRFWLVAAPIQLLTGWISAAAFVNLGTTLRWSGACVGTGTCLLLLGAAGLLGAGVAAWSGSMLYAAAVAWALAGIAVANMTRARNTVLGTAAAALIPVVVGATWLGREQPDRTPTAASQQPPTAKRSIK